MVLNKQKGNMYGFVTHTWNAIKGKCSHDCCYCYMKRFPQKFLRLDEKELKTDLGRNNYIFVGSSTDMFADDVKLQWILKVIKHCKAYPENTYLFQTKNPKRFQALRNELIGLNCVLATTLETNREVGLKYSKAPPMIERITTMMKIKGFRKMITIEPIFDFDLEEFIEQLRTIEPEFVNIGADSNRRKDYIFVEPSKEKLKEFIESVKCFTKVNLKDNLKRIYS